MQVDFNQEEIEKIFYNIRLPSDANLLIVGEHQVTFKSFVQGNVGTVVGVDLIDEVIENSIQSHFHIAIITDIKTFRKVNDFQSILSMVVNCGFIYILGEYDVLPINLSGYDKCFFINRQRCKLERSSMSLVQYWKVDKTANLKPLLLIHPKYVEYSDEIIKELKLNLGIVNVILRNIVYSEVLLKHLYQTTPWFEPLLAFSKHENIFEDSALLVIPIIPNEKDIPGMFSKLNFYKKENREKYGEIVGEDFRKNGFKAKMLPFHVPEPSESSEMYDFIENELGYKLLD